MKHFQLDRITIAAREAPALAAALRRDSAAYAARSGVDLCRLLGRRGGRSSDVRAAVCLLVAWEGARPWRAIERERLERVTTALERLLLGPAGDAERAAQHLRALHGLMSLDDRTRDAAADAALAQGAHASAAPEAR